ncbi:hypothetical protein SCA03_08980 [Streptomyces cacaoi]|uniref:Alpha/beta fold hydrolase n=1 Tax=Streptomyces cacaoi TaxID=1898 RepID=A0A4Y3QUH6_STRCI|nr:hypothetical protein SCA03_08980 [Streptomyces cacaoi]
MVKGKPVQVSLALALLSAIALAVQPATAAPSLQQKFKHRPIVFVHGYNSASGVWGNMIDYAADYGYDRGELHAFNYSDLTYKGSRTEIEAIAKNRLAPYVTDLAKKSPDGKVDIVAHSMGGLVARAYLRWYGGAALTKHYVAMGTPQHGAAVANALKILCGAAFDVQCKQMQVDSDFIKALNSKDGPGPTPGPTKYATFRSNIGDEPYASACDELQLGWPWATLGNATNRVSPCIAHGDFYHDPWTQRRSLDFLQDSANTPQWVKTECTNLTHAKEKDNWVEAFVETCLVGRKKNNRTTVGPELSIRGCGYRRYFWKQWHYTGPNQSCFFHAVVDVAKNGNPAIQAGDNGPRRSRTIDTDFNKSDAYTGAAVYTDRYKSLHISAFHEGKSIDMPGWRSPSLAMP